MSPRFLAFALFIAVFFLPEIVLAQREKREQKKEPLLSVDVRKWGPYAGIQRGKFTNLELGGELQFKKLKLVKPKVHAVNLGLDYNLFENVMGFQLGYFHKPGRFDFTYGGSLLYRTDFYNNRMGLTPTIGYKFSWLHAQLGYALLTRNSAFTNTNTLFVSLRVVLIKHRKINWDSRWKKEKE